MKKKLMTLQQHRLLKEAGRLIAFSERLKHAQKETTGRNREEREEKCRRSAKAASAVTALSGDIEEFLASRYDFRYNLLTDETEFRPAGQRSAAFTPRGQARTEHFLHRSPCRRYSLLGQGPEPIRLFHLHPCLPSLPALHGRTARLGRQGPADCACLPRLFSAPLGAGIPYLDAGTCLAMDGRVRTACQQRGSRSRQPRAGTTEIQLLSRLDARRAGALLHRQPETDLAGTS